MKKHFPLAIIVYYYDHLLNLALHRRSVSGKKSLVNRSREIWKKYSRVVSHYTWLPAILDGRFASRFAFSPLPIFSRAPATVRFSFERATGDEAITNPCFTNQVRGYKSMFFKHIQQVFYKSNPDYLSQYALLMLSFVHLPWLSNRNSMLVDW